MDTNKIIQSFLDSETMSKDINSRTLLSKEKRYKSEQVTTQSSFYITGKNGTGKTHYCTLFIRDYILNTFKNGFEYGRTEEIPSFIKMNKFEYYVEKANGFDEDERYGAKLALQELKSAKLFVLDDFWISQGTERFKNLVKTTLFDIFDYRYENQKQTVITTNVELQDLLYNEDYKRFISRLFGLCGELELPNTTDLRLKNSIEEIIKPKPKF